MGKVVALQIRTYEKPGTHICAAFLNNNSTKKAATITFKGQDYYLPPKSISILPDCKTVVYNTDSVTPNLKLSLLWWEIMFLANLESAWRDGITLVASFFSIFLWQIVAQHNARNFHPSKKASNLKWEMSQESIPQMHHLETRSKEPLELYNMTKDTSDYAWYSTR